MVEKTLESQYFYRGKIVNMRLDSVELEGGQRATREVVEHPGAVGIVPVTGDGKVVLIRQYRKPLEETIWEIPAGKLEPGEDPQICAERELLEETGYRAASWEKLSLFYTTPGFASEVLHLFVAWNLEPGPQNLEPDEVIDIFLVPLQEALTKIMEGEIKDGKTIIGLLLTEKTQGHLF